MEDSYKPLIAGILLSGLVNVALLSHIPVMQHSLPLTSPAPEKKKEERVLFDLRSLPKKNTFIDTPEVAQKPPPKPDFISDKSSQADSSKKGKETGIMPESKTKDLMAQAPRFAPRQPALPPPQMIQQVRKQLKKMEEEQKKEDTKTALDNKLSVLEQKKKPKEKSEEKSKQIDPEEEISKISDTQVSLSREQKAIETNDLFPLPMISLGERSLSENGKDSFNATDTQVGKYIKKMRDKIGLKFNEMVFFHYKTSSIVESKVKVSFEIRPDGRVINIKKEFISGEPFFGDYCSSVIKGSEPFASYNKEMAPFLEDGVLKMSILFGYNIREKTPEKQE